MTETFVAVVVDALRDHPEGITAKELAAKLQWKSTKASQAMGKMFYRGVLDRRCGEGPARQNNEYVYTLRPAAATKPASPSRWTPAGKPAPRPDLPPWAKRYAAMADRLAEGEIV